MYVYKYEYTHTYEVNYMSCECFSNCDYCDQKNNCPYDFMGDGSPFCHEFICGVDECKRSFCISDDEIREAHGVV